MCLINYLQQGDNHLTFESFVESKFGYGAWSAVYWFVGPEEGGGANCVELADRLIAWNGLSCDDPNYAGLLNLREYCGAIDKMLFLGNDAIPQPTWIKLLSLLGQPEPNQGPPGWFNHDLPAQWGQEDLNKWEFLYQREFLCQPDLNPLGGRVALVDISPLPSPKTNVWLWSCIAAEPVEQLQHHTEFETRQQFMLAPNHTGQSRFYRRLRNIRERMAESNPQLVVFYGFKEWTVWEGVVEAMNDLFHLASPSLNAPAQHSQIDETHLFWIYHPSYWGRHENVNRAAIQAAMAEAGFAPWQ